MWFRMYMLMLPFENVCLATIILSQKGIALICIWLRALGSRVMPLAGDSPEEWPSCRKPARIAAVDGIDVAILDLASSPKGFRALSIRGSAILMSKNQDWSAVFYHNSSSSIALSRLSFLIAYFTLFGL